MGRRSNNELYTVAEASRMLKYSEEYLRHLLRRKIIHGHKVPTGASGKGSWRIPWGEIKRFGES